ncbi:hypothetical protein JCM10212_006093 [Sporobolomyces blumeae]
MNYLWSWFSKPSAASPAPETKQLTEEQLHELHARWLKLQNDHSTEVEALLARLVDENGELKDRLAETTRELTDSRAGRKEVDLELAEPKRRLEELGGGTFAPGIFNSSNPGAAAPRELERKLVAALPTDSGPRTVHLLVYVFWSRNTAFVSRLIENGLVGNLKELDNFINGFNSAHPLCMFVASDISRQIALQRQRALALVYARDPTCVQVVLGRWALDHQLAELLAPSTSPKALFPAKVRFVEPLVGFYLAPELKRRGFNVISTEGVLRRYPLADRRVSLEIDYRRPLWKQDPPICLDFYLSRTKCPHERCLFSHAYRIPKPVVESMAYDISRTPCPLVVAGVACRDAGCFFAHECPRPHCDGFACPFVAPGMHKPIAKPPLPTRSNEQPIPSPRQAQAVGSLQSPAKPIATSPPLAGPTIKSPARVATTPSLTRSPSKKTAKPTSPLSASTHRMQGSPSKAHRPDDVIQSPLFGATGRLADLTPVPARHPLSPVTPSGVAAVDNDGGRGSAHAALSDAELRALLDETKKQEEEYERGLREDPFYRERERGK